MGIILFYITNWESGWLITYCESSLVSNWESPWVYKLLGNQVFSGTLLENHVELYNQLVNQLADHPDK